MLAPAQAQLSISSNDGEYHLMYARYCLVPVNTLQNPELCDTELDGECGIMYAYIIKSNPFWWPITICGPDQGRENSLLFIFFFEWTLPLVFGIFRACLYFKINWDFILEFFLIEIHWSVLFFYLWTKDFYLERWFSPLLVFTLLQRF